MAEGAVLEEPLSRATPEALAVPRSRHPAVGGIAVTLTHRLEDSLPAWRRLEASAIESPGQSSAFIRTWVAAHDIAEADQLYVTATLGGVPIAVLPLWRRRARGIRLLSWFPGPHVGCNAPLVDKARLAELGSVGRAALWSAMLAPLEGADAIYLKSVPQLVAGEIDLFAELGSSIAADTLYRAIFSSWEEANTTQRSKSRRKHDRQQGERLDALGRVDFEEIHGGTAALPVLELMFRQRAARFRVMGVVDPFTDPHIRAFYQATLAPTSGVDVRMHVLRLDGAIVAVRYNIAHGDRLFCLISSMSDDPAVQAGSPGKQCLLRVMQSVFDAGYRVFDMGAGLTDEKRHWCNVLVPVRHHYLPLTGRGSVAVAVHRGWQLLRQRIKANPRLMQLIKRVRGALVRSAAPEPAGD